ncbi:hypothetical protein B484DRAFT_14650 [Ochromonadaceae sp. CCMP2298]|nr:hypothetical protein B484DRAFT_14650 [Ochromonadaceae sp. CCMP2298]
MAMESSGNWEASFDKIMSRTKLDMNKVNDRYAPSSQGVLTQRVSNNENLMDKYTTIEEETYARPSSRDMSVLERLARLEEVQRVEGVSAQRISLLEQNLDRTSRALDRSTADAKDLERSVLQYQSKLGVVNGLVDSMRAENDAKRSLLAKLEASARQADMWRDDLEAKVDSVTKLARSLDRSRAEQREAMGEHVSRADLEAVRDRAAVVAQQAASASVSAWHDKFELSTRSLERQVALLRMGRTDRGRPGDEELLASPEEVAEALRTTLPSELLLKGAVAQEVRQLENRLQDRFSDTTELLVKSHVESARGTLHAQMHSRLGDMCAEMGLEYPEVLPPFARAGGGAGAWEGESEEAEAARARESFRSRLLEARRRTEEDVRTMGVGLASLRSDLQSIAASNSSQAQERAGAVGRVERAVEETAAASERGLRAATERLERVEREGYQAALAGQARSAEVKQDMFDRLGGLSVEWEETRGSLERRLNDAERATEQCEERTKEARAEAQTLLQTSPALEGLRRAAGMVGDLVEQHRTVADAGKETAAAVRALQANAATKNEHLELRERVARLEPAVVERLPDYFNTTKKVLDLTALLQGKLETLEALSVRHHSDITSSVGRLGELEITSAQLMGSSSVAAEDVRRLTQNLVSLESAASRDTSYLKDLTGSISSRLVTAEGKVSLMSKTYASDSVTNGKTIARLSARGEELQAQDAALQNSLAQMQWAGEASRRESGEQIALLGAQLGVLRVAIAQGLQLRSPVIEVFSPTGGLRSGGSGAVETRGTVSGTGAGTGTGFGAGTGTGAARSPYDLVHNPVLPSPAAGVGASGAGVLGASGARFGLSLTDMSTFTETGVAVAREAGERMASVSARAVTGTTGDVSEDSDASAPVRVNQRLVRRSSAFLTGLSSPGSATAASTPSVGGPASHWSPAGGALNPAHAQAQGQAQAQTQARAQDPEAQPTGHFDSRSNELSSGSSEHSSPSGGGSAQGLERDQSWDASSFASTPTSPGGVGMSSMGNQGNNQSQNRSQQSLNRSNASSHIPQQSAFDMSMPSYVSHINDSRNDSRNDTHDSRLATDADGAEADAEGYGEADAEADTEIASMGKLSVSSGGSLGHLNSQIDQLIRHKDEVLSPQRSPQRSGSLADSSSSSSSAQALGLGLGQGGLRGNTSNVSTNASGNVSASRSWGRDLSETRATEGSGGSGAAQSSSFLKGVDEWDQDPEEGSEGEEQEDGEGEGGRDEGDGDEEDSVNSQGMESLVGLFDRDAEQPAPLPPLSSAPGSGPRSVVPALNLAVQGSPASRTGSARREEMGEDWDEEESPTKPSSARAGGGAGATSGGMGMGVGEDESDDEDDEEVQINSSVRPLRAAPQRIIMEVDTSKSSAGSDSTASEVEVEADISSSSAAGSAYAPGPSPARPPKPTPASAPAASLAPVPTRAPAATPARAPSTATPTATPSATSTATTPAGTPTDTKGLSVRDRLRLRQEALKKQKSDGLSTLSSASVDLSPPPNPEKPPNTAPRSVSAPAPAQEEEDAVMNFEDLEDSTDLP